MKYYYYIRNKEIAGNKILAEFANFDTMIAFTSTIDKILSSHHHLINNISDYPFNSDVFHNIIEESRKKLFYDICISEYCKTESDFDKYKSKSWFLLRKYNDQGELIDQIEHIIAREDFETNFMIKYESTSN